MGDKLWILVIFLLSTLCQGVPRNGRPDDTWYDCTGLDNGLYIGDCLHFYRCENDTTRMLPCPGNLVVNEKHMWCDYKDLVKPPCGTAPNCTGIIDGNYPDYASRCQQYFTCQHEDFYGYTKCAANLIFNIEKDTCDWPFLVKPPCGVGNERVWPSKPDDASKAQGQDISQGQQSQGQRSQGQRSQGQRSQRPKGQRSGSPFKRE